MIGIKHTGSLKDFVSNLPKYSLISKKHKDKICFMVPDTIKFAAAESIIKLQSFTDDYLLIDDIENFKPGSYITTNCEVDSTSPDDVDFILNLDLQFNTLSDKILCSYAMGAYYPSFECVDTMVDYLEAIRLLANAKERHIHSSVLSMFMNQAKIPYYLYLGEDPISEFETYYKNAPILDVRGFTEDGKIVSIYNKIFFK